MDHISQENKQLVKTGTTTIGIRCKDGIVLIADKKATAGFMIVDKVAKKIHQLDENLVLTIAGLVSDAQFLTKLARAEIALKKVRAMRDVTVREAANLLGNLSYANIRRMSMLPGIVGFLVGGKDKDGFHLYNIGIDGSVTKEDKYTSDGSGSIFVYGVLETLYKDGMTTHEGIELGLKALNAAVQRDAASGCGYDIVTITDKGVDFVKRGVIEYGVAA